MDYGLNKKELYVENSTDNLLEEEKQIFSYKAKNNNVALINFNYNKLAIAKDLNELLAPTPSN